MGKEEIAHNEQFLLFPQGFLLNQKIVSPFVNIFDIISLFAAELEEPEIGMWGKELNFYQIHMYISFNNFLMTVKTVTSSKWGMNPVALHEHQLAV